MDCKGSKNLKLKTKNQKVFLLVYLTCILSCLSHTTTRIPADYQINKLLSLFKIVFFRFPFEYGYVPAAPYTYNNIRSGICSRTAYI